MKTGIYVHIPFCVQRCTYCDFNTYTGLLSLEEAYVAALDYEIALRAERGADIRAETLYFGGGTPSLLKAEAVVVVIQAVRHHMGLPWRAEVTLEANPGTVDGDYLAELKDAGVTRLSFGVQSCHSQELVMLGRLHTWAQAVASYHLARAAGFDEISLDLMFGLPGQTAADWRSTLEQTLALEPDHLSLYALTLEAGTPLAEELALNSVPTPDPDLAADMYEEASETLHAAGFWQYEISNWARGSVPAPDIWALPPQGLTERIGPHISQHNLIYWRNRPWIGLGAGAHSWFGGRRWSNHPHPRVYINAMRSGRLRGFSDSVLAPRMVYGETLMMGLRLAEGVSSARFHDEFGVHLEELYGSTIEKFNEIGLISWDGERVRLTERGRLLGNQVFEAFLLD
ncbi:MAG: radical SAM family heme chaperone HemW [Anaerolineae bacterium]|nr:radical SAM family heme chaperone HemW [Anaerolineae bacterium]